MSMDDAARTHEQSRDLHALNMDVEVPGHDLKRRITEFFEKLGSGETFKMTFRSGGEVKDAYVFYADGEWQFEIIDYSGKNAMPKPSRHQPK